MPSVRRAVFLTALIVLTAAFAPSLAQARDLSFDERVAAQTAIEQVYWNHRIWPTENPEPKPPLSAVIPDAAMRAKVEDYLRNSNALEHLWQRPVTADQLQAELNRMARDSRDPQVLHELFDALGNDPTLIAETLARQTLVDALVRDAYQRDERIHTSQRDELESMLSRVKTAAELRPLSTGYRQMKLATETGTADMSLASPSLLSQPVGVLGPLVEHGDRFEVAEVLQRAADELTVAVVSWPKPSFEMWWAGTRASESVTIAEPYRNYALPGIAEDPGARAMAVSVTSMVPAERYLHTAVWTGSAMIVWGGSAASALNTGGLYFPSTNTWLETSTGAGVPDGRSGHTAVWTGTEMIIWGGVGSGGELNSGGRYVPATDSWTATSTGANVPAARQRHTAVWTGTQMIVWGGSAGITYFNSGGVYDPVADSWTATSTGAGVAAIRAEHTAVWTGTQMIVWGGTNATVRLNTGSRYTPGTNAWVATTTTSAPAARHRHTAVWTGTQMIVWGGSTGAANLNTGSRYSPSSNTWSATATTAGVPTIRQLHTAVWTGTEMIVWGGTNSSVALDTGGRYNPTANTWTAIPSGSGSPASRYWHTAVWTGSEVVTWGGYNGSLIMNSGGRYATQTSTWRPTAEAIPVIEFHPTPQSTILGGLARFTVIASGNTPRSYQWRKDGGGLTDGGKVSGATTDVLTLTGVTTADAGNYSVVVSNTAGSATSVDAALSVTTPQGGDVDFSFDPGSSINGGVFSIAVQPDGKVLIGGVFTSVERAARGYVARLHPDGSTDHTFGNGLAGANSIVRSVVLQPDGRVLIGGDFTTVNGVSRGRVARLNADGSLDTTFLNGLAGANETVSAVDVQSDGRVLIVGPFTTVNGVSRGGVARLNADGSLDTTFLNGLAGANSDIYSVAVQPDGRVLIGGNFTTVNGVSRNFLARLNADGSLDTSFLNGLAGADSYVISVAVQSNGRVLIGGNFTTVNGVSRGRVARLNADGSLDTTFLNGLAGANNVVYPVAVQSDGRVLIGGSFTTVNGVSRSRLARLNADGSLDTTFLNGVSGANSNVYSIGVQADGRVLIGGNFTTVDGVSRGSVARLNADGSLDPTFLNALAGANERAYSLAVQPDGRVLIGGEFETVNGVSRGRLARLNADGSLDTTFSNGLAGASSPVRSIAVQSDGRVLIGGDFLAVNGVGRSAIARLNANGSLDMTFSSGLAGANGRVYSIAVQPDGRVLIGGDFTTVNGVSRGRVARLNADGSPDTTFLNGLSGANDRVNSLALQPDGRVLIGGQFTSVNGVSRNDVARLNADGSLDTTFLNGLAGANGAVYSVAVQPDGRVLIGGQFTSVNGVSRGRIARLNVDGTLDTTFLNGLSGPTGLVYSLAAQPDGRTLVGGNFTTMNGVSRNHLARVNVDGTLDTTFLVNVSGANFTVYSLAAQPDGRVLAVGAFGGVNGAARTAVARLYGSSPAAPVITVEHSAQASYDGCCAVFHVTATGTPRDYQWRKNGVDLVDGGPISGAGSDTLKITGVSPANEGDYSVVVSNVLGSDTSLDAALTVAAVPQCKVATCDPVLGCVLVDSSNGTACNDGNACTAGDTCASGSCVSGAPLVCNDANVCTDDSCNPATGCVYTNNTAACDDGTACTAGDTCASGSCVSGAPLICNDTNACTDDSCNLASGCVFSANTAPCSDGNPCTGGDACAAGSCVSGAPLVCNDANSCTDDSCNAASGCVFSANTASCDDGDACSSNDNCWKSACIGAPACLGIQSQPTPQSTILGGRAVFTVIASGQPARTYQWRKDGVDLSNDGRMSGVTGDALILTRAQSSDAGNYSVVVTDTTGSATSVDASLSVTTPQGGDVDFSFDSGSTISAHVRALAVQTDGKVFIGGLFTSVDGATRGRIARLKPDGSTDHTFGNGLAGANGVVYSIAVQPDGRVLIAGDFTTINAVSRSRVARLNADGSLDTAFLSGLTGANNYVTSVAIQPDGRVMIGGQFTSVNGVSRSRIARLNPNGSLDTTFLNGLAGPDSLVNAVAVQPDGRVLIGGGFTTVNGVSRNFVARLNNDGSLDTTFLNGLTGADSSVTSVAIQPDGRVLIGGFFTSVNGVSRKYVARLNADGSLDTTFLNGLAGASGAVFCIAIQPDGRALIGGNLNLLSRYVARLNADGSLDTNFLSLAGASSIVNSIAVQPDGRMLIGGEFATVNGVSRNHVARLNADGSLDTNFLNGLAGANAGVSSVANQPDGRVLIAGDFRTVSGVSRNYAARLNADGSLDTTFLNGLTGANSSVMSVAVQPNGRVLLGGFFTTINGVSRNRVARLNADGSLDTTFLNGLTGADSNVRSIAAQPDGRLLIAGDFTTINAVSRSRVARLNADGSLDTTFQNGLTGANNSVNSVAIQPDGRVLIGGSFTTVNGVSRNYVARLNADGSLDTTFLNGLAGANNLVFSIAVQPDGGVLIGGPFTTVNGVSRNRIARLNADGSLDTTFLNGLAGATGHVNSFAVQSDGRVLIAGVFTTVNGVGRNYIARLNADGSLDTAFLNGLVAADDGLVSVAIQPDGRVLIAGLFGSMNGAPRSFVARLYGAAPVSPVIAVEPSAQVSYDGCCAVFHVTATGTPRDYRWRKNGIDLVDGGPISGASSDTLKITGVGSANEGDYSVVVSNVLGSDTSLDAALTVAPVPQCKVATCDPVLGCLLLDAPNGTSCNDGNACTAGDSCSAGVCNGACSCLTAADADADGYGNPAAVVMRCDPAVPPGYVTNTDDCNDGNPTIHPGATEICNLADDDCDATVDEGVTLTFYQDADGDFYGNAGSTTLACVRPPGYATNSLDCDDSDATVKPGGVERCDNKRNDCNGAGWPAILDGDADLVEDACETCVDGDGDGWGDTGVPGNLCTDDNCPLIANPDQLDSDRDGRGEVCDACPLDALDDQDGDGVCGDVDNCRTIPNAGQANADGDGFGDVCDLCPAVASASNNDGDHDGFGDACDSDVDGDGVPNATDTDDDGDGVPDDDGDAVVDLCPNLVHVNCDDNCPNDPNPTQRDRDFDGIGDACDSEDGRVEGGGAVS